MEPVILPFEVDDFKGIQKLHKMREEIVAMAKDTETSSQQMRKLMAEQAKQIEYNRRVLEEARKAVKQKAMAEAEAARATEDKTRATEKDTATTERTTGATQEASRATRESAQAQKDSTQSTKDHTAATEKDTRSLEERTQASNDLKGRLAELKAEQDQVNEEIKEQQQLGDVLARRLRELSKEYKSLGPAAFAARKQMSTAMEATKTSIEGNNRAIRNLKAESKTLGADIKGVERQIRANKQWGDTLNRNARYLLGGLNPALGQFSNLADRGGKTIQMLASRSRIFMLLLSGIGIAIVALAAPVIAFFTRTQKGMDLLARAGAQVKAAFDVVADSLANIKRVGELAGSALRAGLLGSKKDAAELSSAFGRLALQIAGAVKQADKLKIAEQNLRNETARRASEEAQAMEEIRKQRAIADNEERPRAERRKALEKSLEIESELRKTQYNDIARAHMIEIDRLKPIKERRDLTDAEIRQYDELKANLTSAATTVEGINDERERALKDFDKQTSEVRKKEADEHKKEAEHLKALKDDYQDLIKSIQDQADQANLGSLFGTERINAEADLALKTIDELEKKAQDAAKKAGVAFTEVQAFNDLRSAVESQRFIQTLEYQAEQLQGEIDLQKTLADMTAEANQTGAAQALRKVENEQAALQDMIKAREDYYRAEGKLDTDEARRELLELRKRLDLANTMQKNAFKDLALERIDQQQRLAEAEAETVKYNLDPVLTAEQEKQKALLEIALKGAQQRLALLGADSEEGKLLALQIQKMKQELAKIGKEGDNPFQFLRDFLKDALKIDDAQLAKLMASVGMVASSLQGLITGNTDIAIEENERLLSSIEKRITETEKLLDDELEKQKAGYANNVASKQKELDELKAQEAKAQAEQKQLKEQQLKDQLISDSLAQASSMGVAIAGILSKSGSLGPVLGPILAAAAILSFVSLFKKYKANTKALSQQRAFKGGPLANYLHGERDSGYVSKGGASDKPGRGNGYAVEGTNLRLGGNEFVMSEEATAKYAPWLAQMNAGRFQMYNDIMNNATRPASIGFIKQSERELKKATEAAEKNRREDELRAIKQAFTEAMDKHADKMIRFHRSEEKITETATHRIRKKGRVTRIIRKKAS